jgi:hypothetical protein
MGIGKEAEISDFHFRKNRVERGFLESKAGGRKTRLFEFRQEVIIF